MTPYPAGYRTGQTMLALNYGPAWARSTIGTLLARPPLSADDLEATYGMVDALADGVRVKVRGYHHG